MKNVFRTGVLVVFVFLSACQNIMNFTPERAVLQAVVNDFTSRGWRVDSSTIQVKQQQSFQDKEVFLLVFQADLKQGFTDECIYVYNAVQERGGWQVGGSGGGCGPASPEKVYVGAGGHVGSDQLGISYVYGLVNDPEIRSIEITWSDDELQKLQVTNGSFLAVREYIQNLDFTSLEGLDAENNVIYVFGRETGPAEKQDS